MIRVNCAIWLVLLLIALPMMRRRSKPPVRRFTLSEAGEIEVNDLIDPVEQEVLEKTRHTILVQEPTLKEAFKDYRTLYIWIMILCSSSYPFYIASNFKTYELIDVKDETFVTLVGSIGAAMNGLSRGVWSTLQDYFGFKKVYLCLLALQIVIAFTFVSVHKIKPLFLIWVGLSFTTLGGQFSIFPTVCAKIYGPTIGGKVFSILFSGFATATLLNWILSKQTSRGNIRYEVLFYILASLGVVAFIMMVFFNEKSKVHQLETPVKTKFNRVKVNESEETLLTGPDSSS